MYQCSKKLATYKEYSCFDHSEFPAHSMLRSSRPGVFCKKGVLRNFIKFTGKYLCQSLFLNKFAGLRPEKKKL